MTLNIKKNIKVKVYNAYSDSSRVSYITKTIMTKKQFDKYIKDFRVQEFKDNDSWRTNDDPTYSWEKGYINELSD